MITLDHNVEEIIKQLKPLRGSWSPAIVAEAVKETIKNLMAVFPLIEREAIRKARDDARDVAAAVRKLEGLINRKTLSPQVRIDDDLRPALDRQKFWCQHAEEGATSNNSRRDQLMYRSAYYAHNLICRYSTKRPTSGSSESSFRLIAGLLYGAVAGGESPDLRRACEAVLKVAQIDPDFSSET